MAWDRIITNTTATLGCIVCDPETIIVLVLLAFNFILQRSHHSLALPRLWIRDSATVTRTSTVLLRKRRNILNVMQCQHKGPSLARDTWPHSTWRQVSKTFWRMASELQINSLPGLLAVMIRQQISITNRLKNQSTTLTDKRRQWRTRAEHGRVKSGPIKSAILT